VKLLNNKVFLFPLIFMVIIFCSSILGTTCGPYFIKGIEQYQSQNYDSAIQIFNEISKSTIFTNECISSAFIYVGICEYLTGNSNQAQAKFIEAIKLFPDIEFPDENLSQDIVNLFISTKSRLVCNVEIYVKTPFEAALDVNNEIKLIYRLKNVLPGKIKLLSSKYNEKEMGYNLASGKLNKFYLQIERLRDYHAYDSLVMSFYPFEDFGKTKNYEELDDGSFVVKAGSQKIPLERNHYQDSVLSSIEITNDGSAILIPILESDQMFNKVLRDLSQNNARRKFNNAIKKASVAGFVITAGWSIYAHTKINSAYDEYLMQVYPNEIQASYRNYLGKVHKRNNLAVFAAVFALIRVVTEYTEPGEEEDILKKYNKNNNHNISLLIKPDVIGLKYALPL